MAEQMTEMEAVQNGLHVGTIKWFDTVRAYGFIVDDVGQPEVFVHQSAFSKAGLTPVDNARIAFKPQHGPKGISATELAYVKGR